MALSQQAKLDVNSMLRTLEGNENIRAYEYQQQAAEALFKGHNVLLRVPTGCGKTWSAVLPFLLPQHWEAPPHRLIYVLPLRTLIESIAATLQEALSKLEGWSADDVRVQTGVNADDPFFSEARIVVTTFDQLLSGLLGGPYGKGPSLHNINSAAMAGCLVVFDEFHLMEPDKAFMTALAGCKLFQGMCQSVWMTATATSPLCNQLVQHLNAVAIDLTDDDASCIKAIKARKCIVTFDRPLCPSDIVEKGGRRLVVVNQVKRAQKLYQEVKATVGDAVPVVSLHSRFFPNDRVKNQTAVLEIFGKSSKTKEGIVIATQVVEAGLDITADFLLSDLAPASSLVQRAGRCARYGGYGEIHIFALPEEEYSWLPYGDTKNPDDTLDSTWDSLRTQDSLSFKEAADLVENVHKIKDESAVALGLNERYMTVCSSISQNNIFRTPVSVTHLIREEDISVNLIIENLSPIFDDDPLFSPWEREAVKVSLHSVRKFKRDFPDASLYQWTYSEDGKGYWKRCDEKIPIAFYFLVSPSYARYTDKVGLELGESGEQVSPSRECPERPGYQSTARESWVEHATNVKRHAVIRWESESKLDGNKSLLSVGLQTRYGIDADAFTEALGFTALAHDLGKLQEGWQEWAFDVEKMVDPSFLPVQPLAHTSSHCKSVSKTKPRHALQGAYLAYRLMAEHGNTLGTWTRNGAAISIIVAILSHHGGSVYENPEIQKLHGFSSESMRQLYGDGTFTLDRSSFASIMQGIKRTIESPDNLQKLWPLVSYIVRILRLSDQIATAEGGEVE